MLCEDCQKHGLHLLGERDTLPFTTFELGQYKDLVRRQGHCDFCFLVVAALEQLASRDETSEFWTEKCWASWQHASRSAFTVWLGAESGRHDLEKYGGLAIKRVARPPHSDANRRLCYRPLPRSPINKPLFLDWRRLCHETHGSRCADPKWLSLSLPTELKLIDVTQRTICPAPDGAEYAALSYVWGRRMSTAHVSTEAKFKTLPAMLPGSHELPQAIEDALHVTQALGLRYLWVDAICIPQCPSDNVGKAHHLAQMDTIFKAAELVIAAVASKHASLGMLGGNCVVRKNIVRHIGGVDLALAQPDFEIRCERSTWAQRAWTFQENMLARRLLLIGECESQWVCQCAQWLESEMREPDGQSSQDADSLPDTARPPERVFDLLKESVWGSVRDFTTFNAYTKLVQTYTSKALSRPDDGLNAVQGILNMLKIFDNRWTEMYSGLPAVFFDPALLWRPVTSIRRDPRLKWAGKIPSWSWAGWVDSTDQGMRWDEEELFSFFNQSIQILPAIEWYVLGKDGRSVSMPSFAKSENDWQFPETTRSPCGLDRSHDPFQPPMRADISVPFPGYFLHFMTTTIQCYLGSEIWIPELGERPLMLYTLFNDNGEFAGHIELAAEQAQELRSINRPMDLIFLSYSRIPHAWCAIASVTPEDVASHHYPPWFGFDPDEPSEAVQLYSAINALWVERGPNGVAERIQRASCVLKAWESGNPKTEWVLLG